MVMMIMRKEERWLNDERNGNSDVYQTARKYPKGRGRSDSSDPLMMRLAPSIKSAEMTFLFVSLLSLVVL